MLFRTARETRGPGDMDHAGPLVVALADTGSEARRHSQLELVEPRILPALAHGRGQ